MKLFRLSCSRWLLILAVVMAGVLAYAFWPTDYFLHLKVMRLKSRIAHMEPDDLWNVFSLSRSCEFVINEEKPELQGYLRDEAGLDAAASDLFLGQVAQEFRERAVSNAVAYSRITVDYWGAMESFDVDSDEVYTENPAASRLITVTVTRPQLPDADIYISPEGEYIFALSRSSWCTAVADVFQKQGKGISAYRYLREAALDQASLGTLSKASLQRLSDIPEGLSSNAGEAFEMFSVLLDSIYDESTITALRNLLAEYAKERKGPDGKPYRLLNRVEEDTIRTECDGVTAYVDGDYEAALSCFKKNTGAGLPGTFYYMSLCCEFIARQRAPGAAMADISDYLRISGPKKTGRESLPEK
ncbi:MAG: hypothetical protein WC712_00160 [Candidatus Brocadiia bacterium]